MHELKSSIARSLCDQIFTSPIHSESTRSWLKATNLSETATHAINFGPGGLSGIRSLTATRRNLDGCGVCVVITGDKGKGYTELFSSESLNIKYESAPCWNKKWAP